MNISIGTFEITSENCMRIELMNSKIGNCVITVIRWLIIGEGSSRTEQTIEYKKGTM